MSLVKNEVIEIFIRLLDSEDSKTVTIVLEALKNILQCGAEHFPTSNDKNPFLEKLESLGGV